MKKHEPYLRMQSWHSAVGDCWFEEYKFFNRDERDRELIKLRREPSSIQVYHHDYKLWYSISRHYRKEPE